MALKATFSGDKNAAKRLYRRAQVELGILKQAMSFQNLFQGRRVVTFTDGTIIEIRVVGMMDLINVFAPPAVAVPEADLVVESVEDNTYTTSVYMLCKDFTVQRLIVDDEEVFEHFLDAPHDQPGIAGSLGLSSGNYNICQLETWTDKLIATIYTSDALHIVILNDNNEWELLTTNPSTVLHAVGGSDNLDFNYWGAAPPWMLTVTYTTSPFDADAHIPRYTANTVVYKKYVSGAYEETLYTFFRSGSLEYKLYKYDEENSWTLLKTYDASVGEWTDGFYQVFLWHHDIVAFEDGTVWVQMQELSDDWVEVIDLTPYVVGDEDYPTSWRWWPKTDEYQQLCFENIMEYHDGTWEKKFWTDISALFTTDNTTGIFDYLDYPRKSLSDNTIPEQTDHVGYAYRSDLYSSRAWRFEAPEVYGINVSTVDWYNGPDSEDGDLHAFTPFPGAWPYYYPVGGGNTSPIDYSYTMRRFYDIENPDFPQALASLVYIRSTTTVTNAITLYGTPLTDYDLIVDGDKSALSVAMIKILDG